MKKIILVFLPFLLLAQEECVVLKSALPCTSKPLMLTAFDILYWQAQLTDLEYAIENDAANNNLSGKVIRPDFEWRAGFRAALGFHLPYDDWILEFQATHFDSKSRKDNVEDDINLPVTPGGQGLVPVWTHPAAFSSTLNDVRWQRAHSKWKLNYNVIDAKLGRSLCISPVLSISSYFGIKNSIIHQNFRVKYSGGNIVEANGINIHPLATEVAVKNFSYGIGPLLALNTKWQASPMWSFFSDFSCSILHTHFEIERVENDLSSNANDRAELNEKYWTYKPEIEGACGINLDICSGTKQHIGISLAYEIQYWFKQNQIIRFIDSTIDGKTRNTLGNLFLHGLSINFQFDY